MGPKEARLPCDLGARRHDGGAWRTLKQPHETTHVAAFWTGHWPQRETVRGANLPKVSGCQPGVTGGERMPRMVPIGFEVPRRERRVDTGASR
jgi:hypothetical protein